MSAPSNYLRVAANILATIGDDEFCKRYPGLVKLRHSMPPDTASIPDVREIFKTIRDDLTGNADVIDRFLMQAARLDLQQAGILEDYSYLNETSPQGAAVQLAIGEAMNLPFGTANYLCHLSNKHKYLYVATPKAACTTIKHALQQVEMDSMLEFRKYGDEHFPTLSPLLAPLDEPRLYFTALQTDDWFRFTFVRDPFDRALSCYLDKIVNSVPERHRLLPELGFDPVGDVPSFADFLKAIADQPDGQRDLHWAPQSWLTQPATMRYHFIGRLERFDQDFHHVCDELGIVAVTDTVRHSTKASEKLASFYGGEEIRLVQTIYAADFTTFCYDGNRLKA